MRKHNGMRPQDIAVLLKIILLGEEPWQSKDIAQSLCLSSSEVSESLSRNQYAKLLDHTRRKVMRNSFYELLKYGLPYIFPAEPGSINKGLATAHSHPLMKKKFPSEFVYVWPDVDGESRGQTIEPLYPKQVEAAKADAKLYEALALIDVLRAGKIREKEEADKILRKLLLHEPMASKMQTTFR